MSPRWKTYTVHIIVFISVFLLGRWITDQLMNDDTWEVLITIALCWIIAPRPHVEQTQSGNQYGLKWLFFKKIIKL